MSSSCAGRTALVTGGAGFLGRHLCQRLARAGCRVVATSRRAQPAEADAIEWRQPDLEDADAVRRLIGEVGPDFVYHFAGDVGAAPTAERVLPVFHSLLTSTVHVLLAALAEGRPRVLLAGSLTEPDDQPGLPVPSSPYSAAKWAASGYARMFAALYELDTVILRPFMAYGPGQKPEKIVPYVVASCLRGETPRLSSGRQRSDWIYVDDVVEAAIAAATAPGLRGLSIDLGTGDLTSTREVVETIVELTGSPVKPAFGALPERPLERERQADTSQALAHLDWRARTPLRTGLERTIEFLRRSMG